MLSPKPGKDLLYACFIVHLPTLTPNQLLRLSSVKLNYLVTGPITCTCNQIVGLSSSAGEGDLRCTTAHEHRPQSPFGSSSIKFTYQIPSLARYIQNISAINCVQYTYSAQTRHPKPHGWSPTHIACLPLNKSPTYIRKLLAPLTAGHSRELMLARISNCYCLSPYLTRKEDTN